MCNLAEAVSGVCGHPELDASVSSLRYDQIQYLLITLVVAVVAVLFVAVILQLRLAGANIMRQSETRGYDPATGPSPERGKMLCDQVYSLHEPEGQPEVEIVFIHGLSELRLDDSKDSYWTTWLANDGSEDNCWPMTWLADEFPKARILSVSYDVKLALQSSASGTMDLYPVGESLVQEMVLPGVGIGQNGCPVIFVCHCLGGLIAKQVVVMAHEKFKADKEIDRLLKNIKAFVFYATPHGGSELVEMIPEIGRLNSTFESIQRNEFNNKWTFSVVAEAHATTYKSLFSSMMVKEHSARHVGYDHVIHVQADHFDVCRPRNRVSTSFLYLSDRITDVISDYKRNHVKFVKLPSIVVEVDDNLSMLCKKLEKNSIIGLVGMGGVGKTTLSKIMYNSKREHFERLCFLEDVKSCRDIITFQQQLFRELCDEKWDDHEDVAYHLLKVQDQIKKKEVLVVIDDVGTTKNLENLYLLDAFKYGTSGSKLIITCRDRAIVREHVSHGHGEILEVHGLSDEQAMQLFSHYAFHDFFAYGEMDIEDRVEFEDRAIDIVKACGGLPLSLEVVGQHLRRQNHLSKEERLEMWNEALQRLKAVDALEGHENEDEKLWAKLRISYDDLGMLEKELFLDFACILCDMEDVDKSTLMRIWHSRGGLQTLIDSSLIKVVFEGFTDFINPEFRQYCPDVCYFNSIKEKLVMHDQLQDLGRRIVMDEAKRDILKYKHLWIENEIQELLAAKKDAKRLEGLSLIGIRRLWKKEAQELQPMEYETSSSQVYHRLRLFNLSGCPLNVVDFVFEKCQVKSQHLNWLCLNHTATMEKHLKTLDGRLKGLRVLQLRNCMYLFELPSSIGGLSSLNELDLSGCRNLESLSNAIGNLVELLKLDLSNCTCLKRLPTTIGSIKLLKSLNLANCWLLEEIPTSVGQLSKLECLILKDCESLHTMCEFETRMHHLSTLNLDGCTRLRSFKSLGNLYRLQILHMPECDELRIPNLGECLGQMSQLQHLNLLECGRVTEEEEEAGTVRKRQFASPTPLPSLESLYLSTFPGAASLPFCPRLRILGLHYHGFLDTDDDEDDKECEEGEDSDGEDEELRESFQESLGHFTQLQLLVLIGFPKVPESVGHLTQLQELCLGGIRELPDSLTMLLGLKVLYVWGMKSNRLPEHVGCLASLHTLKLKDCCRLVELPESVGNLSQLRYLKLRGCKKLERLPGCLPRVPHLSKLNLRECHELNWKEEGQYAILKQLHERGCKIELPEFEEFPG